MQNFKNFMPCLISVYVPQWPQFFLKDGTYVFGKIKEKLISKAIKLS